MPPWRLDPLVEERLERCRVLLAEPGGPHEGSAEMRNYVEYADTIVAYHRLALDAEGRPHPSLSRAEGLELCTLFCKAISCHPLVSLGIEYAQTGSLMKLWGGALPTDEVCGALMSMATQVAGLMSPFPQRDYERKVQLAAGLERLATELMPREAARLPQWLAQQGSRHTITVLELRRMAQYRVVKAALKVLEEARAAGLPLPPPLLRQAAASASALVALAPDWPRYLILQGEVFLASGEPARAAACYRRAIEAATGMKAHYWAGQGAADLALVLMGGAEGPQVEVQRLQQLLEDAEREFKLSRAWAAASYKRTMADVRDAQACLKGMVQRGPAGAARLPADLQTEWGGAPLVTGGAHGVLCGLNAVEVKKCSACKSVTYCSRECQVKHWKQPGGHKAECAALAAQRTASTPS